MSGLGEPSIRDARDTFSWALSPQRNHQVAWPIVAPMVPFSATVAESGALTGVS
jgi:hypothetical protein